MRIFMKKGFLIFVSLLFVTTCFSGITFANDSDDIQQDASTAVITIVPKKSEADLEKEGDKLEQIFLNAIKEVTKTGKLYALNIPTLIEKQALFENCGIKYAEDSQGSLQEDFSENQLQQLNKCIEDSNHPQIESNDTTLINFQNFWFQYTIKGWFRNTQQKVPHPLLIVNKIAVELGSFSFLEDSRPEFKKLVSKGILLILERKSLGIAEYNQQMTEVLGQLKKIFETKWRLDNTAEPFTKLKDYDQETFGRKIHKLLAKAKNKKISPKSELEFGKKMAEILFPMYSCVLKLKELQVAQVGKDCQAPDIEQVVELGEQIATAHEELLAKDVDIKKKRNIDLKLAAVMDIVKQYSEMNQMNQKREEQKEQNPLLGVIKLD